VDSEKKGLMKGCFQDLLCSFFPNLPNDKKFSEICDQRNNNKNNDFNSNLSSTTSSTSNTEPLTQAEAHITISSYSIVPLDYVPSRHSDFIKLGATDDVLEFHLSSIHLNNPKKLNQQFARKLELDFRNCTVIVNKEL
jgi:hypothetical protein